MATPPERKSEPKATQRRAAPAYDPHTELERLVARYAREHWKFLKRADPIVAARLVADANVTDYCRGVGRTAAIAYQALRRQQTPQAQAEKSVVETFIAPSAREVDQVDDSKSVLAPVATWEATPEGKAFLGL